MAFTYVPIVLLRVSYLTYVPGGSSSSSCNSLGVVVAALLLLLQLFLRVQVRGCEGKDEKGWDNMVEEGSL